MPKNERTQNFLKATYFDHPDWIPAQITLLPSAWLKHGEALDEVAVDYPQFFPGHRPGSFRDLQLSRPHQKGRWTDAWGVMWDNAEEGISAIPVDAEAPLQDWDALDTYRAPDLLEIDDHGAARNWDATRDQMERTRENGGLPGGGLIHGFMFMRLFYLRGFSNFMLDVATRDPRLGKLIDLVLEQNVRLVQKYLELGAENFHGGDDMGMQTGLTISPRDWLHYLKPCFEAIWGPTRDRDVTVYQHSDGHILDIIPHLVECGVDIVDPQIRANTLQGIVDVAKGKVCVFLDLDRQLFPFATEAQARSHIIEAKEALYQPEGGLMMKAACAHDVSPSIVRTICETFVEVGGGPK